MFDSIATQNAEIRTVANSLPPLLKYFAKSLFLNQLSLTDKNLKYTNQTISKKPFYLYAFANVFYGYLLRIVDKYRNADK